MSLPVINTPTYELVQPSTKDTIAFRPFLVKEEKILLLALEENNEKSLAISLKQIINNCTFEKVDVEVLPLFDLEYMFLKIRAKSVGETAKVRLLCEDDGETYAEVEIDLEEVEVFFPKNHTNTINITDEVVLEMRYPTYELLGTGTEELTVEKTFDLIGACINRMIEGETVYDRADWTEEELKLFIENLTSKQFAELQTFFETMPKLSKEVSYTNPKTKKKNKMTLEGLQSFFV